MNLESERTSILNKAVNDFKVKGCEGIFLSGSLAEGTSDKYSDIDLRIVIQDSFYSKFLDDRQHKPKNWGKFLFFETIGKFWTVSYYEPFNKVDVFYYKQSEFKPDTWLSLPVKILFDPNLVVQNIVSASQNLEFSYIDKNKHLAKCLAYTHEIIKQTFRGNHVYAVKIFTDLIHRVLLIKDEQEELPPYGVSHLLKKPNLMDKDIICELNFDKTKLLTELEEVLTIIEDFSKEPEFQIYIRPIQIARDQINNKLSHG